MDNNTITEVNLLKKKIAEDAVNFHMLRMDVLRDKLDFANGYGDEPGHEFTFDQLDIRTSIGSESGLIVTVGDMAGSDEADANIVVFSVKFHSRNKPEDDGPEDILFVMHQLDTDTMTFYRADNDQIVKDYFRSSWEIEQFLVPAQAEAA